MGKRRQSKKRGKKRSKQGSFGRERRRSLGDTAFGMECVGVQEQKDRDTARIVEEILEKPQVRMHRLRRVGCSGDMRLMCLGAVFFLVEMQPTWW